jgi:hypothetical protein
MRRPEARQGVQMMKFLDILGRYEATYRGQRHWRLWLQILDRCFHTMISAPQDQSFAFARNGGRRPRRAWRSSATGLLARADRARPGCVCRSLPCRQVLPQLRFAAKRVRHTLTMPVVRPTSRAMARAAIPSAASRTMARQTMRCSLFDAGAQPSSVARIFRLKPDRGCLVSHPSLNHASQDPQMLDRNAVAPMTHPSVTAGTRSDAQTASIA